RGKHRSAMVERFIELLLDFSRIAAKAWREDMRASSHGEGLPDALAELADDVRGVRTVLLEQERPPGAHHQGAVRRNEERPVLSVPCAPAGDVSQVDARTTEAHFRREEDPVGIVTPEDEAQEVRGIAGDGGAHHPHRRARHPVEREAELHPSLVQQVDAPRRAAGREGWRSSRGPGDTGGGALNAVRRYGSLDEWYIEVIRKELGARYGLS